MFLFRLTLIKTSALFKKVKIKESKLNQYINNHKRNAHTHTKQYPIIISKSSGVHSPHLFLFPAYYHDVIQGKPKFRWYPTKNTMVIIGIFRTSVWWSVTSACVKNSLFVWFFSSLVVIHLNVFLCGKTALQRLTRYFS